MEENDVLCPFVISPLLFTSSHQTLNFSCLFSHHQSHCHCLFIAFITYLAHDHHLFPGTSPALSPKGFQHGSLTLYCLYFLMLRKYSMYWSLQWLIISHSCIALNRLSFFLCLWRKPLCILQSSPRRSSPDSLALLLLVFSFWTDRANSHKVAA